MKYKKTFEEVMYKRTNAQMDRLMRDISKYPHCIQLYRDLAILQSRLNEYLAALAQYFRPLTADNRYGERVYKSGNFPNQKGKFNDLDENIYLKHRPDKDSGEIIDQCRYKLIRQLEDGSLHSAN